MSSGWRYGYDTVLMHRCIQGETLYTCDQFGVDGKMYVALWLPALWQICRRSSLKYEGGNGNSWQQNLNSESKRQICCWTEGPRGFFMWLVMIHTHTECCACMCL